MMKKIILLFAFSASCLICVLLGFYFGQLSVKTNNENIKPPSHKQSDKSTIKNQIRIPVLGCAIKQGNCECYGRNTDDFSFLGDGKMTFDLSVCEDYIKHSGGSRYITIVDESEESEELREIRKEFRSSINKKLEEITRKK